MNAVLHGDANAGDQPGPTSGLLFPVVGIGASAGGLTAIRTLLDHMPADSGMAFVVILHLSPKFVSTVDKILQAHTRMPVQQVRGATDIQPNCVYVIPPRSDLVMAAGHLEVTPAARVRGPHVAIDVFFRTLAEVHCERAMAIVMSGTGSDGTLGLARIKERGGMSFAQAPTDSEYGDMPRNAIDSGQVDFVLPAAEMPQQLMQLWENAREIALPPAPGDEPVGDGKTDPRDEAEAALQEILQLLNARTGHDFSHYKRATVLRRIKRRLQVRTLKDIPAYRDYLRENPDETDALLQDMLISVTNFFRDREAFGTLEREVIPGLVARYTQSEQQTGEQIRVWVPGCATGEEAYSIAMLLHEEAARHAAARPKGIAQFLAAQPPRFHVFASDIDEPALAVARSAVYPTSIVADVSPSRLRAFFTRTEVGYAVTRTCATRDLARRMSCGTRRSRGLRHQLSQLCIHGRDIQESCAMFTSRCVRGILSWRRRTWSGDDGSADRRASPSPRQDRRRRRARTPTCHCPSAGAPRPVQDATLARTQFAQCTRARWSIQPPSLITTRRNIVHIPARGFLQNSGGPVLDLLAWCIPRSARAPQRSAAGLAGRKQRAVAAGPHAAGRRWGRGIGDRPHGRAAIHGSGGKGGFRAGTVRGERAAAGGCARRCPGQ